VVFFKLSELLLLGCSGKGIVRQRCWVVNRGFYYSQSTPLVTLGEIKSCDNGGNHFSPQYSIIAIYRHHH